MDKNLQFGFNVRIKFKKDSPFGNIEENYRNVTEIHYNYPSAFGQSVAFESDIHGTGGTKLTDYIKEFEATLETKKQKDF